MSATCSPCAWDRSFGLRIFLVSPATETEVAAASYWLHILRLLYSWIWPPLLSSPQGPPRVPGYHEHLDAAWGLRYCYSYPMGAAGLWSLFTSLTSLWWRRMVISSQSPLMRHGHALVGEACTMYHGRTRIRNSAWHALRVKARNYSIGDEFAYIPFAESSTCECLYLSYSVCRPAPSSLHVLPAVAPSSSLLPSPAPHCSRSTLTQDRMLRFTLVATAVMATVAQLTNGVRNETLADAEGRNDLLVSIHASSLPSFLATHTRAPVLFSRSPLSLCRRTAPKWSSTAPPSLASPLTTLLRRPALKVAGGCRTSTRTT